MSLPRSRSHSGPTNPRNKSQMIPKRKHDSRSKGLSCPATTLADGPRAWGERSADTRRMVRYPWVDGPLITIERPNKNTETRTVRTWSSDDPQATGAERTVRDPQADSPARTRTVWYPYTDGSTNHLQQNFDTSKDLRTSSQELDEHATKLHLTDGPRAMGGQSASPKNRKARGENREVNLPYPTMDLPNGLSS
jgi:hypothetical protein